MASPNLEGRASRCRRAREAAAVTHADAAARSAPAPLLRTAGHTWHETVTDGRVTRVSAQAKMKAAVFAALATTAAAFAPVARPLAAAAATKLSVVPETVAELPSMLTVRTLCGNQPANRARLHRGCEDA